jgi:hypothetical protein
VFDFALDFVKPFINFSAKFFRIVPVPIELNMQPPHKMPDDSQPDETKG